MYCVHFVFFVGRVMNQITRTGSPDPNWAAAETQPETERKPLNKGEMFFAYEGAMRSRESGRGTVLEDIGEYFDSNGVLPPGDYVTEIRVWKCAATAETTEAD
jgi:hypothetical protein